ncbi:hypothetical protein NQU49_27145, partial [Escherichia coli]|uniref:hypothetical protein n=1 Tax=Escherichia coli TaxID=562 RepID=UPI00211852EF
IAILPNPFGEHTFLEEALCRYFFPGLESNLDKFDFQFPNKYRLAIYSCVPSLFNQWHHFLVFGLEGVIAERERAEICSFLTNYA